MADINNSLPVYNLSSSIINQNNLYKQKFLGFYSNKTEFNNLFNQELKVEEDELFMLLLAFQDPEALVTDPVIIYRYKWAGGKGTFNPIPNVEGIDILFESVSQVTGSDIITIINGANTQTYDLGDIGTNTIIDFINVNGPYDLTDTELVYYFIYQSDNITYLYQFIGINGTYGSGETLITNSDLNFITSSAAEPSAITNTSQLVNDGADGINPFITLLDVPTPSLQDTIDVDKNADRVRFYHEVFPLTKWTSFVYMITVVPSPTDDKFYVYGDFSFGGIGNDIARFNADGTYDTTFNVGTGLNNAPFAGCDVLPLSDGKLYIAGFFTSYNGTPANRIIKLNNDGTIDTSFDYGTGFNQFTTGLALDSNDKLYVIARNSAAYKGVATGGICRINTDGTRDSGFNSGSGFNNSAIDVKVDSSDKVYVTGYFSTYQGVTARGIVRLNSDGTIDTGFAYGTGTDNTGNQVINHLELIQSEGKILFYGMFTGYNGTAANRIIKLNEDGSVEPTFLANMGTGFNDRVFEAKVTSYGTILCTGQFTSYNGVATNRSIELNLDGTIYKVFPQSLLYNSFLLNDDVFLGLTLNSGVYTLSSIIDYYPVNTKTLTFNEVTGKAEYKIGGLDSTSEEELLPKRLIREFIQTEAPTPILPTKTSDLTNDGEDGVNPFIIAEDIPSQSTVLIEATLSDLGVSTFDEVTPAKLAEYTATLNVPITDLNTEINYKISEDEPIVTYLNIFEFNDGYSTTLEDIENTIGEPLIDGLKIGNTIYFNNVDYYFELDTHTFDFINRVVTQAYLIGSNAFSGTLLTQIEAPRCVTISDSAFLNCTSLSGYDFPLLEAIDENCFANCFSLESIIFPSLTNVAIGSFSGCENVVTVILPSATVIGSDSFQGCVLLEEIEIPSVIAIGFSVSDDAVFDGITGQTISVTAPVALQTANGGNLEGDLQYLDDNNTVTFNWV